MYTKFLQKCQIHTHSLKLPLYVPFQWLIGQLTATPGSSHSGQRIRGPQSWTRGQPPAFWSLKIYLKCGFSWQCQAERQRKSWAAWEEDGGFDHIESGPEGSWVGCNIWWEIEELWGEICRDKFLWLRLINYETCILWMNQTRLKVLDHSQWQGGWLAGYHPSLENDHCIDEEVMDKLVEDDMMGSRPQMHKQSETFISPLFFML